MDMTKRLPPPENESVSPRAVLLRTHGEVRQVKRLRFHEFKDAKLISIRMPHRSREWIQAVIDQQIYCDIDCEID